MANACVRMSASLRPCGAAAVRGGRPELQQLLRAPSPSPKNSHTPLQRTREGCNATTIIVGGIINKKSPSHSDVCLHQAPTCLAWNSLLPSVTSMHFFSSSSSSFSSAAEAGDLGKTGATRAAAITVRGCCCCSCSAPKQNEITIDNKGKGRLLHVWLQQQEQQYQQQQLKKGGEGGRAAEAKAEAEVAAATQRRKGAAKVTTMLFSSSSSSNSSNNNSHNRSSAPSVISTGRRTGATATAAAAAKGAAAIVRPSAAFTQGAQQHRYPLLPPTSQQREQQQQPQATMTEMKKKLSSFTNRGWCLMPSRLFTSTASSAASLASTIASTASATPSTTTTTSSSTRAASATAMPFACSRGSSSSATTTSTKTMSTSTSTSPTITVSGNNSSSTGSSSSVSSPTTTTTTTPPDEAEAYHAGLIHTEFTPKLLISKDTPVIPIFRVLNYEGKLTDGWEAPFSNEEVVDVYQFMVKLSIWDNLFYNIQRQGRISFYIQNQGEEALQAGVGKALDPRDHLFCQYRELGVLLLHGFTEDDVLEQLFARKGDESKGRQMPISYSKKAINLHTICTPLTTQVPHAAGAGYAFKVSGEDRIAVTFFGEGAASEGDFHAAMNFASTLKSQTLFACRNNGYAISTPVKDQYAGDGIAIRGISYGMKTVRVDGNDVFACYLAAQKAREIVVQEREPVLIEFMTYRVGHHSTSDDSMQYRPQGELEKWNRSGVHPIARLRRYLEHNNLWTDEEDEKLRKAARTFMLQKLKAVEKHKRWPVVPGIFDDVYDKEPWHLSEQREDCAAFLEKHKDFYPQLKEFESIQ